MRWSGGKSGTGCREKSRFAKGKSKPRRKGAQAGPEGLVLEMFSNASAGKTKVHSGLLWGRGRNGETGRFVSERSKVALSLGA